MLLFFWMLATAAGQDIKVIEEDTTETHRIEGPAVILSDILYRQYIISDRQLVACEESLYKKEEEIVDIAHVLMDTASQAQEQFEADALLINDLSVKAHDLGVRLDKTERKLSRTKQQRNLAFAIAGSLVAGSAATIYVISR